MLSLPRSRLLSQKVALPPSSVKDGTSRRILEVALKLFATQGFHGTSIRELAKILELQPSALYAHFASKEQVLAELVRVGHETHLEYLRAAMLKVGSDPIIQLEALVRAHATMHATHPLLAVVVNEEMHALPPELAAPGHALREQATALMLEVIDRGVSMGVFSVRHRLATAAAIGAMGLRIPYWFQRATGLDVEALADTHAELALRMLGART
jgi:AcrR family transcriptional regulator